MAEARVLVVDDEINQGRSLAIGLKLEGFDVETAIDATAALRTLEGEGGRGCDVAILDLMLPGMNGIELAREIGRRWPATRVVLTSAYHLSERQLLRADCGVVGFVPKPYRLDELVAFLRSKLSKTPDSCRRLLSGEPFEHVTHRTRAGIR